MASDAAEDYEEEADEAVGVCDDCGNLGVLREVNGRVLCQSCRTLVEDSEEE